MGPLPAPPGNTVRALMLAGMDTLEIAQTYRCTEADVWNRLAGRSATFPPGLSGTSLSQRQQVRTEERHDHPHSQDNPSRGSHVAGRG